MALNLPALARVAVAIADHVDKEHDCADYGINEADWREARRLLTATRGNAIAIDNVVENEIQDRIQLHVSACLV